MESRSFVLEGPPVQEEKGDFEGPSRMNDILEEFTKLYTEKLERINEPESGHQLKRKVAVLESWVRDLGEQNGILVATVEELEREAAHRVSLLQERLDKMAFATRESCVALRDHEEQMTSLVTQKLSAEEELKNLQQKVSELEEANGSLLQDNSDLRQDLDNVIVVVSRSRITGRWDYSHLTFKSIRPEQVLGSNQSYQDHTFRDVCPSSLDLLPHNGSCSSIASSHLRKESEERSVPKLKQEVLNLKNLQRETNFILTQRDEHIADLQSQLTELHHKLAAAQAQVNNTTSTLHSLMDRGRHDSFEICRRDDVIRQLLSPTRNLKSIEPSEAKAKFDVEVQLSDNIDVLALRLNELEEECQRLRHQNEALGNSLNNTSPMNTIKDSTSESNGNVSSTERMILDNTSEKLLKSVQTQTDTNSGMGGTRQAPVSPGSVRAPSAHRDGNGDAALLRLSKLENELAEKKVVIQELQNHLEKSREEIRLKDQTLYNMEQKLDSSRRGYDEKEERLLYLTSQLTSLQLEVSRLHGNAQHLRMQVDKKSHLVLKLEAEAESVTRQLNERSLGFEAMQREVGVLREEQERRKKEIAEQKVAIGTLQDALISSKLTCDKLRTKMESQDVGSCCAHRSGSKLHRRIHKGLRCSCRRARSAHSQEELQILELKGIIDELSTYLKEAEQMAQTVEEERDLLEGNLEPSQSFHLRETRRQRASLQRIRSHSSSLMLRLRALRDDLTQCGVSDLLPKRRGSLSPDPSSFHTEREPDKILKPQPSNHLDPPQQAFVSNLEVNFLRDKMAALEVELKKEKSDREMLSDDANAVISSVRQWLHFQKAANSHLEEKFRQQRKQILILTRENQNLNSKFRNCSFPFVDALRASSKTTLRHTPAEDPGADQHDSMTNDTGLGGSPTLTSSNSPSALGGR